jgi:hypothetical protein
VQAQRQKKRENSSLAKKKSFLGLTSETIVSKAANFNWPVVLNVPRQLLHFKIRKNYRLKQNNYLKPNQ